MTIMTVLYIAGPMTGKPFNNYPAFDAAEDVLTKKGFVVENPANNPGSTWEDFLRASLVQIARSDGVALLPGWSESRGACLEVHVASVLSMPIRTVDEWVESS